MAIDTRDLEQLDGGVPPTSIPPIPPAAGEATSSGAAAVLDGDGDDRREVAPNRVALAALLATMAAAWMVGGVFIGFLARAVALVAAVGGVGGVALAVRRRQPWFQYVVVAGAFVLGYIAALVLPNDTGITGTVPELVRRAIANGGLTEPPVPFDPGWRFLVVALIVLVGGAAASLATGLRRPRLALGIPLPLVIAAALSQPPGGELLSGGVALLLLVGGLMVIYAAELSEGDEQSKAFEVRQLARGGLSLLVAVAALGGLSRLPFLFPDPAEEQAAKPQKPRVVPLEEVKDRPLFTVKSEVDGPWRLGVLDVYQDGAWLLPPFDLTRLEDPADADGAVSSPSAPLRSGVETLTATFTVRDLGGFTLPAPANPISIEVDGGDVGFDPRTQVFRTRRGSPGAGYTYTVTAPTLSKGTDLLKAAGDVPDEILSFQDAPNTPLAVVNLLAGAPNNPWDRLQFVRTKLYENVVAAGSGVPVDISSDRVVELLNGAEGTPFEVVAAEALLARWAGVPSRIGYGFKGGSEVAGGRELRPKDGANWLEVWFPGHGWVPIVGVPPKAKASITTDQKNVQPQVRPSDDLSLQIYVPIQNPDPLLLFQVVRYWMARALPVVMVVVALWMAFPWPLKSWRRRQRRRWATEHGPAGRIAVAYSELRDVTTDLGIGDSSLTPLAFLDRVVDDEEHEELAWLVTRALFGDLARDLRVEDALAAEELAMSVSSRLMRAQTGFARLTAAVSRASLREPFDPALPNPWPRARRRPSPATLLAAPLRALRRFGPARWRTA